MKKILMICICLMLALTCACGKDTKEGHGTAQKIQSMTYWNRA